MLSRPLDQLADAPALQLAERPRLGDADHVARMVLVVLVVRVVLLGARHLLAVQRVRVAALHLHHHRLVHLVGHDGADAGLAAAALLLLLPGLVVLGVHQRAPSFAVPRSVSTVFRRAMSRRIVRSSIGLSSCCVAERKRSRKRSSWSWLRRSSISSVVMSRTSAGFTTHLPR